MALKQFPAGGCDPCEMYIDASGCTDCAACLPLYLCCRATMIDEIGNIFTYSSLLPSFDSLTFLEGGDDGPPGGLITPDIHCGWAGAIGDGPNNPLLVFVEVYRDKDDNNCYTKVVIPFLSPYDNIFEGVLPDGARHTKERNCGYIEDCPNPYFPPMEVSGFDGFGREWDITLFNPGNLLAPNPRAIVNRNPLCKCKTCLPKQLCFRYLSTHLDISVGGIWNCITESWDVDTNPYLPSDITVKLSNTICGIEVTMASTEFSIGFEGRDPLDAADPEIRKGIQCEVTSDFFDNTSPNTPFNDLHRGHPRYELWQVVAGIFGFLARGQVINDEYGNELGTLTIRDFTCGLDCFSENNGTSIENPYNPYGTSPLKPCCGDVPITLHATANLLSSDCSNCVPNSSIEWVLTYDAPSENWISDSISVCGANYSFKMWCSSDSNDPVGSWSAQPYCSGFAANSPINSVTGSVCTPFHIIFTDMLFGAAGCNCTGTGTVYNIVVTA